MLQITDPATGRALPLRLPRGSLLRVHADLPADRRDGDLTAVRVLLLADVLARATELRGLQAVVTQTATGSDLARLADLARVQELLGIRPSEAGIGDAEASRAEAPADVRVLGSDDTPSSGVGVRVGSATLPAALPVLAAEHRFDPLAVRLLLVDRPYADPVNLTVSDCRAADATLARWRDRVAMWAEHPSQPIPAEVRAQAQDALDDDLATSEVLNILRRLEDEPAVPDGAKFEAFAFLDRILGLHLARDVGR